MICLSIRDLIYPEIIQILQTVEMAEIRLDFCPLSHEEITSLFSQKKGLIATCRPSETIEIQECSSRLKWAMDGINMQNKDDLYPKYIDLDINTPKDILEELICYAKKCSAQIIISYHNYNSTPNIDELKKIVNACYSAGADLAKLATYAINTEDGVRVMQLYKLFPPSKLLAFCMGENGRFSRRLSIELGSPYAYVSLGSDNKTADGQYTLCEMTKILDPKTYSHKFRITSIFPKIESPASKSHSQRAIVAACLSEGITRLYGYTPCKDSESAIALFRSLGIIINAVSKQCYCTNRYINRYDTAFNALSEEIEDSYLEIHGVGFSKLKEFIESNKDAEIKLFVGESGLLTRLMVPIAAVLVSGLDKSIKIIGEGTILKRDFSESKEAIEQLGLNIRLTNNKLPLSIFGNISANKLDISGQGGSQLVSGLLMALPNYVTNSIVNVENPTSSPYIDVTISTLDSFGINIINNNYRNYLINGSQVYKSAHNIAIDGDWSSASTLLVAGAISGGVSVSNLYKDSGQADERIFSVLEQCGVKIHIEKESSNLLICGDPYCKNKTTDNLPANKKSIVKVSGCKDFLKSFNFDSTNSPDLFPALTVLALNCRGKSAIKGVTRLFNKESNRAEALYTEFTKLGAEIDIIGDYMYITGGDLHGGYCSSYNDHRIAMALICASITAKGDIYIDNIDCLNKSFPTYLNLFN